MTAFLLLLFSAFTPLTEEKTLEVLGQLEGAVIAEQSAKAENAKAQAVTAELRTANENGLKEITNAGISVGKAQGETKALQDKLDIANDTIATQKTEIATLNKQWWHLFWLCAGEGIVIVGLLVWIFK